MDGIDRDTMCPVAIDTSKEELMYFTIYSDINDVEGLVF
jgi:hypothetical protein